ncbi:hypothetical protein HDV63DRAFT_390679 [Trichoderma sp. SZMC 28014]
MHSWVLALLQSANAEMRSWLCIIRVWLPLFRDSLYELSPRFQLVGISNRLPTRGSGFRDFGPRWKMRVQVAVHSQYSISRCVHVNNCTATMLD